MFTLIFWNYRKLLIHFTKITVIFHTLIVKSLKTETCESTDGMEDPQYIGDDQISVSPFSNTYLDARTGGKGWLSNVDPGNNPSIKIDLTPNGGTENIGVSIVNVMGNARYVLLEARQGSGSFSVVKDRATLPINLGDSFKASALRITLQRPIARDIKQYNVTVSINGCFKKTSMTFLQFIVTCLSLHSSS